MTDREFFKECIYDILIKHPEYNQEQKKFAKKLLPDKTSFHTTLNNWLKNPIKPINNEYKMLIANKIGFNVNYWGDNQRKEDVKEAVEAFLNPFKIPYNLIEGIDEDDKNKIYAMNKSYKNADYKEVIRIYEKDLKEELKSRDVKILYTHALASLDQHKEAANIFASLIEDYPQYDKIFDLQTSLISALKRKIFEDHSIDEGNLGLLKEKYKEIFQIKKHYYPAVNYAYALWLESKLFGVDNSKELIALAKDNDIKRSIGEDKNSENVDDKYYAFISETELKILAGKNIETDEVASSLEQIEPHKDLVKKTLRQMELFFDKANLNEDSKEYKIIDLFKDYIKFELENNPELDVQSVSNSKPTNAR